MRIQRWTRQVDSPAMGRWVDCKPRFEIHAQDNRSQIHETTLGRRAYLRQNPRANSFSRNEIGGKGSVAYNRLLRQLPHCVANTIQSAWLPIFVSSPRTPRQAKESKARFVDSLKDLKIPRSRFRSVHITGYRSMSQLIADRQLESSPCRSKYR